MVASPGPYSLQERVRVEGHSATVKYLGEVAGQDGEWVGVEWDQESRGKNDGTVKGRTYFSCRGQSGSFIRLQKFLQLAERGKPLLEAVSERYCPDSQEDDLSISTINRKHLQVKLVGRAKAHARQRQLDTLRAANLASASIHNVGLVQELQEALPCLAELDLSDNLFSHWTEVAKLATGLPRLRLLNLSRNLLQLSASTASKEAFQDLRTLVLNGTGISWAQVQHLEGCFPELAELHLCSNSLSTPEQPLQGFHSLEVLDLDDNLMSSWNAVLQLGSLPSLQRLHLARNSIQEVTHPPDAGAPLFQQLQTLLLADNQLSSWSSIDALSGFSALREARLSGNPLFFGKQSSRAEVIARVAGLNRLNGSSISASERKDAELQYLRQVSGQLEQARSSTAAADSIKAAHPRLDALIHRYGDVGSAVTDHTRGSTMRAGMVQLTLSCPDTGMTQTKKLPGSMTVAKLKVLCQRLFQIPVAAQVLTLHEGATTSCISDDEGRDLAFYDLQGSAAVTIRQADLAAEAAAAAKAKQLAVFAHEQRMQQHDRDIDLMKAVQEQHFRASQAAGPG